MQRRHLVPQLIPRQNQIQRLHRMQPQILNRHFIRFLQNRCQLRQLRKHRRITRNRLQRLRLRLHLPRLPEILRQRLRRRKLTSTQLQRQGPLRRHNELRPRLQHLLRILPPRLELRLTDNLRFDHRFERIQQHAPAVRLQHLADQRRRILLRQLRQGLRVSIPPHQNVRVRHQLQRLHRKLRLHRMPLPILEIHHHLLLVQLPRRNPPNPPALVLTE